MAMVILILVYHTLKRFEDYTRDNLDIYSPRFFSPRRKRKANQKKIRAFAFAKRREKYISSIFEQGKNKSSDAEQLMKRSLPYTR